MGIMRYNIALKTTQDAILDIIRLALGVRIPVADLTGLVAIPSPGVRNKAPAFVANAGYVFVYDKDSVLAPDGRNVLTPTDVGSGSGRWIKQTSQILDPTGTPLCQVEFGYVKRVMLWSGEFSDDAWRIRVLNQRPAVILQTGGETKNIESNQRGNFTRKQYHFSVWGASQNLRPDLESETGSPVSADSDDPGVIAIMGDLEYLLDGLTGEELGVDGFYFMMLDAAQPGIEDYDGREYVWAAPLDARITAGKWNQTATPVNALFAQFQEARLNEQTVADPANYIMSGLGIAIQTGFTAAPADGSAMIGGIEVDITGAPSHTFTPDRATYRDLLPDGSYTYIETYTQDPEPPVTATALRIAVTFTDFAGIIEDRPIAMQLENYGPNNQIV